MRGTRILDTFVPKLELQTVQLADRKGEASRKDRIGRHTIAVRSERHDARLVLSGPFSAYKLIFAATDRGELNTVLVLV